ncbi:hypothetical protein L195_g024545 [Trifolium pratense]|uniref:Uncharacterized protein n=1 Tax=Trifolium pratense TaxID=57577 RepID=A0A2K3NDY6_TRIPR|nr:hypothetical protein L195_g024545 [Trifolium pratense]
MSKLGERCRCNLFMLMYTKTGQYTVKSGYNSHRQWEANEIRRYLGFDKGNALAAATWKMGEAMVIYKAMKLARHFCFA